MTLPFVPGTDSFPNQHSQHLKTRIQKARENKELQIKIGKQNFIHPTLPHRSLSEDGSTMSTAGRVCSSAAHAIAARKIIVIFLKKYTFSNPLHVKFLHNLIKYYQKMHIFMLYGRSSECIVLMRIG
jgi:hypothetical protein